MRRALALPEEFEHWLLTTLREDRWPRRAPHGRYVVFQLPGSRGPRMLFTDLLH